MLKSYKYRLYPTDEQKVLLAKHFGCARWIYNYGLAIKTQAYQQKQKMTCLDIANKLPELKESPETGWLGEVNAQSLQMALRNLDNAYQRFFKKRAGFPKFKSKHNNKQSFQCPQQAKVNWDTNKLFIPKFKDGINAVFHRKFEGQIKTVTISKNAAGRYFAAVLVEDGKELPKKKEIKNAVGIDVGLNHFLTLSDGTKVENPHFLKKSLKRLAVLQRRFGRKQKRGKNRERARLQLARLYERITNQRQDFLHKVSAKIINDNQIDTICLEDLNVKGMLKNKNLAFAISDVGWSKFVEFLKYKAEWTGKNVIEIGRFDPSSKLCSNCGVIKSGLTLADRVFNCECGHSEDRDVNAAKNIKTFALAKVNNNSGEDFPGEPVEKVESFSSGRTCSTIELSRVKSRKVKTLSSDVVRTQRNDETGNTSCETGNLGIYYGE